MGLSGLAVGALAGGTLLSVGGQMYGAEAEKNALKFNAAQLRQQKAERDADLVRQGEQIAASNRVATAKSGVRMTGSPLEVAAANAAQIAEMRMRVARGIDAELALNASRRETISPRTGLAMASEVLSGTGQAVVAGATI